MGRWGRIGCVVAALALVAGALAWWPADDPATSVHAGGDTGRLAEDARPDGAGLPAAGGSESGPPASPTATTAAETDGPSGRRSGPAGGDEFVAARRRPTTTTTSGGAASTTAPPSSTTTMSGRPTSTTTRPTPPTTGGAPTRPTTTTTGATSTTTGPRPGPSAERILVYSKPVGPQEVRVFIGDVDGRSERPLTSGPNDQFPAWSPDGSTIVFSRYAPDGSNELWTIRPDGSGLRQLTSGGPADKRDTAWSPDGRFLAFTGYYRTSGPYTWSVRIVVMELATGRMSDVSAGHFDSNPVWAPDNTTLVYTTPSPSRQDYELMLVTRQGTNRRVLLSGTPDTQGEHMIASGWSVDGSRILAYHQNNRTDGSGHIITIRPDGTGRHEILSDKAPFPGQGGSGTLQFLSWSPDEQSVTFFTAQGLGIVNTDGSGHRGLDPEGDYRQRWQADWKPG